MSFDFLIQPLSKITEETINWLKDRFIKRNEFDQKEKLQKLEIELLNLKHLQEIEKTKINQEHEIDKLKITQCYAGLAQLNTFLSKELEQQPKDLSQQEQIIYRQKLFQMALFLNIGSYKLPFIDFADYDSLFPNTHLSRLIEAKENKTIEPANTLLDRLAIEAEKLYKVGFTKIVFEQIEDAYCLILPLESEKILVIWIPPQYPQEAPKVLLKDTSMFENYSFESEAWSSNLNLSDIVLAFTE